MIKLTGLVEEYSLEAGRHLLWIAGKGLYQAGIDPFFRKPIIVPPPNEGYFWVTGRHLEGVLFHGETLDGAPRGTPLLLTYPMVEMRFCFDFDRRILWRSISHESEAISLFRDGRILIEGHLFSQLMISESSKSPHPT